MSKHGGVGHVMERTQALLCALVSIRVFFCSFNLDFFFQMANFQHIEKQTYWQT